MPDKAALLKLAHWLHTNIADHENPSAVDCTTCIYRAASLTRAFPGDGAAVKEAKRIHAVMRHAATMGPVFQRWAQRYYQRHLFDEERELMPDEPPPEPPSEDVVIEVQDQLDEALETLAQISAAEAWSTPKDDEADQWIMAEFGWNFAVNGEYYEEDVPKPPEGYARTDKGGLIPTTEEEVSVVAIVDRVVHRTDPDDFSMPVSPDDIQRIAAEYYEGDEMVYTSVSGEAEVYEPAKKSKRAQKGSPITYPDGEPAKSVLADGAPYDQLLAEEIIEKGFVPKVGDARNPMERSYFVRDIGDKIENSVTADAAADSILTGYAKEGASGQEQKDELLGILQRGRKLIAALKWLRFAQALEDLSPDELFKMGYIISYPYGFHGVNIPVEQAPQFPEFLRGINEGFAAGKEKDETKAAGYLSELQGTGIAPAEWRLNATPTPLDKVKEWVQKAKDLPGQTWEFLKNLPETAKDTAKTYANQLWEAGKDKGREWLLKGIDKLKGWLEQQYPEVEYADIDTDENGTTARKIRARLVKAIQIESDVEADAIVNLLNAVNFALDSLSKLEERPDFIMTDLRTAAESVALMLNIEPTRQREFPRLSKDDKKKKKKPPFEPFKGGGSCKVGPADDGLVDQHVTAHKETFMLDEVGLIHVTHVPASPTTGRKAKRSLTRARKTRSPAGEKG